MQRNVILWVAAILVVILGIAGYKMGMRSQEDKQETETIAQQEASTPTVQEETKPDTNTLFKESNYLNNNVGIRVTQEGGKAPIIEKDWRLTVQFKSTSGAIISQTEKDYNSLKPFTTSGSETFLAAIQGVMKQTQKRGSKCTVIEVENGVKNASVFAIVPTNDAGEQLINIEENMVIRVLLDESMLSTREQAKINNIGTGDDKMAVLSTIYNERATQCGEYVTTIPTGNDKALPPMFVARPEESKKMFAFFAMSTPSPLYVDYIHFVK